MPLKWYGPQFKAHCNDLLAPRVTAAAIYLKNEIRKKLSRSQKTVGKGIHKRGLDPSAPGEYPKKVTGQLRRNINHEFDKKTMTARVGTNVIYGKYLETGTRFMKRRPWLSNGLRDFQHGMRRILETGRVNERPPKGR